MHNYASHTSRKSRAVCGIEGLPYAAGAAVIRHARYRERQGAGDAGAVWGGLVRLELTQSTTALDSGELAAFRSVAFKR